LSFPHPPQPQLHSNARQAFSPSARTGSGDALHLGDILEEARNAAVHLAGNPLRMTLAKLADAALRAELDRLKREFNDGKDFPQREDDLRGGRPIAA